MRVGAVDCGTNSIRLLVADVDDAGRLTDVERTMRIVRLGQGVDVTGRIADEAMTRTLEAARDYAATCQQLGCEAVRFVATSASRDASNAQTFIDGVAEAFAHWGIAPEVISGDEEAQLSFRGATIDLRGSDTPQPYLVVDLGGGSTEFVRGTDTVEADDPYAVPVGRIVALVTVGLLVLAAILFGLYKWQFGGSGGDGANAGSQSVTPSTPSAAQIGTSSSW